MSKYYNLSQDSINLFNQIFDTKAFPLGINFAFIGHEEQKELIKITKSIKSLDVFVVGDKWK